ncbi:2TM domain-containing protein [Flavobacterium sp. MAH-1]|uniref:2TM domain-containing protein n=1 Tax=Flavobacterium agri TaxID=2743471 RepID=A0A7Y8Y385_9FLAO|nr:2TM domain-containing protein [Flavobacterium agri]NUY81658.1 2TM domain-containing protein [Flavobacterium agri]NYA71682.1 2TM domain-containing protein [Flavobacterium agri]
MRTNVKVAKAAKRKTALGFNIHFLTFLVLTPVVFIVWYLTDTTYPWPLWSTPAWAVGVIFHYLGVFVFGKKTKYLGYGNE